MGKLESVENFRPDGTVLNDFRTGMISVRKLAREKILKFVFWNAQIAPERYHVFE